MFFFSIPCAVLCQSFRQPSLHDRCPKDPYSTYCLVPSQVTKCTWYMLAYGGPTPKPHYALSNSKHTSKLWTGKLKGWARAVREDPAKKSKTVIKYQDSNGKSRWKGSAKLRESETCA